MLALYSFGCVIGAIISVMGTIFLKNAIVSEFARLDTWYLED